MNEKWCDCQKHSTYSAQGYCSDPCIEKGTSPDFQLMEAPTEQEMEEALKDPNIMWNTDQYQDTETAPSVEQDNNNNNNSSTSPSLEKIIKKTSEITLDECDEELEESNTSQESDEAWTARMIDTVILLVRCKLCESKEQWPLVARRSKLSELLSKQEICIRCHEKAASSVKTE